MYTPQAVIVSKKFWDKLSADEKQILQEAATETATFQRQVARDQAAKVLAELKTKGMTVHELSAEEIAKLRERADPVIAKYTKDIGEPLLKEAYDEVAKVRASN